jgi:predicted nucleic acid-binding protein
LTHSKLARCRFDQSPGELLPDEYCADRLDEHGHASHDPSVTRPNSSGLLDTGAAIALIVEDHEAHAEVLAAVGSRRLGLAGHAWFETYSVLTRLPGARRRSPADALRLLAHDFPASRFLDERAAAELGPEVARLGVSGGAVYDALVGAAARNHRQRLLSTETRARPIYEALGVDLEVIGSSTRR